MSKIAKKPVEIQPGVTVSLLDGAVKITGPRGELNFTFPEGVIVKVDEGKVIIGQKEKNDIDKSAALGLTRALINNMMIGVSKGFEKKLELSGVGYRAQAAANTLTLSVGYSHPVKIVADQGITFNVTENIISVSGINKEIVGDIAAKVRSIRPPEPYKGKGIRYVGERIRRKVGKAAKAVGVK